MDPVEALNEIGFWLERERAVTYKVEAFRKAARTLEPMGSTRIAEAVRTKRLSNVKGIGKRTFEVVSEAVAGEVPEYLAELRARNTAPLTAGGAKLRKKLRGDLHSHSDWSDGGSPIDEMAKAAHWRGRDYQALTDHSPRLTVANGLSVDRLKKQLDVVAEVNESYDDFRLLTGIEVDILDDGKLDQTKEMLDRLDIVVASVHSKLGMPEPAMTRRMVTAISSPHTNVLGHCTGRLVEGRRGTRPESKFDAELVFAACERFDVAVEINSRPERLDPPDRLLEIAIDMGCLFSINTDAHAPGQLDFLDYGAEVAERNGIPAKRIVTTWPLDELLAWSNS